MRSLPGCFAAALFAMGAFSTPLLGQRPPAGFVPLFDGKTLRGWRGDPAIWSVRNGAISLTTDKALPHNTYLIHDGTYRNFEIRLKYRLLKEAGNSGLQFRSGQTDGEYVLGGLQANITPIPGANCVPPRCGVERVGMLSDELNRLGIAMLGEKATITRRQRAGGGGGQIVRTVTGTTNRRPDIIAAIKTGAEWNEVVVIAYGGHILHAVNNVVVFDANDNDPLSPAEGLIGLQAHADGAIDFEYKDIIIKPLTSFPDISGRFVYNLQPLAEPMVVYRDITISDGKPPASSER